MSLKDLINSSKKCAKWLMERLDEGFMIVAHYDADGLSAASLMAKAFIDLNSKFQLRIVDQLDKEIIGEIMSGGMRNVIFLDFGSGYLNDINELSNEKDVMIIDHHELNGSPSDNIIELNPHRYGFNGGTDASTSTLTFLVTKNMDPKLYELSNLAVAGPIGDRQDCGVKRSLCSINKIVIDDATSKGYLEEKLNLLLPGSPSTPIVRALANMVDPPLPLITGDEAAASEFLNSIGITPLINGRLRVIKDLNKDELRTLASGIIKHILAHGGDASDAEKIYGYDYYKPRTNKLTSSREIAIFLNACGRLYRSWYAIETFVSGQINESKIEEIMKSYRREIAKGLEWAKSSPNNLIKLPKVTGILAIDQIKDRLIGVIVSIIASSDSLSQNKVVVGLSRFSSKPDMLKVSARAPRKLVDTGVNLGKALMFASREVNGTGGGHDAAAGAQIPEGKEMEFLEILNKIISAQLGE